MARIVKVIIPDAKWVRPREREEFIELIELTFNDRGNRWSEQDRKDFCGELGIFVSWDKCPTACLRRILNRLEHYRMILFED